MLLLVNDFQLVDVWFHISKTKHKHLRLIVFAFYINLNAPLSFVIISEKHTAKMTFIIKRQSLVAWVHSY